MILYRVEPELEVRLLEPHHAGEVYAAIEANREHIRRWLPWADASQSVGDLEKFIEGMLGEFAKRRAVAAGMWVSGVFAGGHGFQLDLGNRSAAMGYWVRKEMEGKGWVTRATDGMVRYLFQEFGLERIEIRVQKENERSRRIAERLGFREEGTMRRALRLNGASVDVVVYSMMREEWRG